MSKKHHSLAQAERMLRRLKNRPVVPVVRNWKDRRDADRAAELRRVEDFLATVPEEKRVCHNDAWFRAVMRRNSLLQPVRD